MMQNGLSYFIDCVRKFGYISQRDSEIEGYQVIQAAPYQAYPQSRPASFRISVPA